MKPRWQSAALVPSSRSRFRPRRARLAAHRAAASGSAPRASASPRRGRDSWQTIRPTATRTGHLQRAPAVRVRGALHRPEGTRALRPRRPLSRLQRQRALGRQPARRRRRLRRASTTTSPTRSAPRAMVVSQRQADDRRRGARPRGRCSTSTSSASAHQVARRRLRPRRHLHLRHPRRVGARHASASPASTETDLERQRLLRQLHGRARRRRRSSTPTARCARRTIRYAEAMEPAEPAPVLVLVSVRRRPAHAEPAGGRRRTATRSRRSATSASTPRRSASTPTRRRRRWISADWPHFFRAQLEQRFGGVAIEMAGSVGSIETPAGLPGGRSRATPQHSSTTSHPAGCRTLFDAERHDRRRSATTARRRRSGEQLGGCRRAGARQSRAAVATRTRSGARARDICVPLTNTLFAPRRARWACSPSGPATRTTARSSSRSRRTARTVRGRAQEPGGGVPDRRRRVHLGARRGLPVHVPAQLPRARRHAEPAVRRCRPGRCRTCTRRTASSTGSART